MTRGLTRWIAALLTLSAFFGGEVRAEPKPVDFACETPSKATDFLASLGVNTHFQQGWQYANYGRTVWLLKRLGIRQIRDAFTGLGNKGLEHAAREKIRFNFIIGPGWDDKVIAELEQWEERFPGSILTVEGPNEVNNWPVTYQGQTGIPAAQAFQQHLYDGVHGSPILRHIPVLALTSWPDFPNKHDIANMHVYSRSGEYVTRAISAALAELRTERPKPTWITEVGYHTLAGPGYFEGVSERAQGNLTLATYLSAFSQGIQKTFVYQFLDQYTDLTDQQAHFGLIDLGWRLKPAYVTLQNAIVIMGQDAGETTVVEKKLAYSIDGLPPTASHALFQTASGAWLLAIWNERLVWDTVKHADVPAQPTSVAIRFPTARARISIYNPSVDQGAMTILRQTDSAVIKLGDETLLVEVESNGTDGNSSRCGN